MTDLPIESSEHLAAIGEILEGLGLSAEDSGYSAAVVTDHVAGFRARRAERVQAFGEAFGELPADFTALINQDFGGAYNTDAANSVTFRVVESTLDPTALYRWFQGQPEPYRTTAQVGRPVGELEPGRARCSASGVPDPGETIVDDRSDSGVEF